MILLNAASSNPDITYKAGTGEYRWTFRSDPTDELRAKVVVQYGAEKRPSSFGKHAPCLPRVLAYWTMPAR